MSGKNTAEITLAEEFTAKIKTERRKARTIQLAPMIALIALMLIFGVLENSFLSFANLVAILSQLAIPLTVSIGITFVVLMGTIDLSVDGVMGLTGSVVSLLILNNKTVLNLGLFGVLIAIAIGALAGFLIGIIHVKAKLPSFMVSFGMASITTGAALLSYAAVPATIKDSLFRGIALNSFLSISIITWISLIILIIGYILQEYTAFGRYVLAIGDNEGITRLSGINVDRIKILAFTWSGLCIGLGGIMGAARLGRGDVLIGKGNLFPAMTAVVVGGTALSGGKGGVLNTLLGALIVTVLQNGLILLGVSPYIQSAIQGIIIIVAVSFSVARGHKIIAK